MGKKKPTSFDGLAMINVPTFKVPVTIDQIIREMAKTEDRPVGNMIRQLLVESPRLREHIETGAKAA